MLEDRLSSGGRRDAHLRLLRPDRRARPAGDVRRAARLRPVRRAQRAAHRPARLGGAAAAPATPSPGRPPTTCSPWPTRCARPPARAGPSRRRHPGRRSPARSARRGPPARAARQRRGLSPRGAGRPAAYPPPPVVSRSASQPSLADLVKAYDVRGLVPDQLDEELARALGAAFVGVVRSPSARPGAWSATTCGRPRPGLAGAFADGARAAAPTSPSSGWPRPTSSTSPPAHLGRPGAMFTASHNPAAYNGIKLCRAGARPVGQDTGLAEIRDLVAERIDAGQCRPGGRAGAITERDVLADYAAHLRGSSTRSGGRPLKVVVDAGNGMAGLTAPAVLGPAGRRARSTWCRCTSSSTAPSPTTRRTRSSRRTCVDLQAAVRERTAPTSGWPSTATPTAASSSTSAASR